MTDQIPPLPEQPSADAEAPIRVALTDDQQLVRAGLAMVIASQDDMTVVGEASNGPQAIRLAQSFPIDVFLMDVRMPDMDGLSATEKILELPPAPGATAPPKVIVLTTFDLDEYALGAIRAGASGFLLKDAPPEDLLSAIRTIHRGDGVIAPSTTRRLIERLAGSLPDPATADDEALASLTDREREVLILIARGLTNTEIATELYVAEATVKTHVGRILAKMGARDRVQLVVAAYEKGLVRPAS